MKPAKPVAADTASHRRSQPARQARTNPSRSSAKAGRAGDGRGPVNGHPLGNQPIEIFPAITHFADTISALPKELVRHFTLLKEVDAKIFAPQEQLFQLVAAISNSSLSEVRANNDAPGTAQPSSAPMSTQNSSSGMPLNLARASSAPSLNDASAAPTSVFDSSNIPRRQLFRQTAFKVQEMLVSLEEKNHVLSTANEALSRQLARAEDVWPYLENEFSNEAKWGSTTHWAYPENRTGSKVSHAERARRDGAAAISAAAQALAEEAAARSDARKQAVQAKRGLKNQQQDSDADDLEARQKEPPKKATAKSRKAVAADTNTTGLGISASTANGNPPPKRRKVEKTINGGNAATGGSMSTVLGANAPKPKAGSPRGTPGPEGAKKRKALPTGSGQAKKKNGMSPSVTSSPMMGTIPDAKAPSRASPPPTTSAPRPASSRARQNSIQSNVDNGKARPTSSAANKPNGNGSQDTAEMASVAAFPRAAQEAKPAKEASSAPAKTEPVKKESDRPEASSNSTPTLAKKDTKPDEPDGKSEPVPPQATSAAVTTKSGRASKPSTPALSTFQDAARSRPSRSTEAGARKGHKKSGSVAQVALIQQAAADTDASSSMQGDDEDGDIDADEPTYCYCNSVSYGEMVACDADDCKREWFHLACVGLKVAPGSKTKWYCEDCKDRLKMGTKKSGGR
ncbi:p33ING1b (ING1) protein [Metarhizium album ARSEF 1941]|uniref:Chromatin modification-related protein n=1 Tax=Metarhizium album (strain ARSEF 1941) TaxID=1081103 RepID=A0A0B2WWW1_METAS|nr:p33ING1b (ING1) protein [Metarhizium album ARSEF 1941]KHN97350.1 p33ING1b (ING1) protein [Metarhizium album ARSEF 1941]